MLKINLLFVSSGNSYFGLSPIVKAQGESLKHYTSCLTYYPIKGRGLLNYLKHILLIKKELQCNRYDIIHAHYGLCGIVAQIARRKEKLVVSFMGDDLIGSIKPDGKYSLSGEIMKRVNRFFILRYNCTIVKSKQLYDSANTKNKEIVPNGVDLNVFFDIKKTDARNELGVNETDKLIIFVSNPARPEKNFGLAKEAVDLLSNDIILKPVFNVPQEQLRLYYGAADILILTSFHEGSPNVIKEAMACNCPIVSTDVGDVKWVIGDTEGCFLVSETSNVKSEMNSTEKIQETSDKIQEALRFAETVGRTKGRERIIELGLDSETIAKRIISIYEKVLRA